MGIINPRPALRKAGIRRIKTNLRDHADHMARFQAQGMSRDDASKEAFAMVKAGIPTEPLRPWCKDCGWRKGGIDSWDGSRCKCGHSEPPLRHVGAKP